MTLSARMIIVLTFVGLISGGFLATVGLLTQEKIYENKQNEIREAITKVVPGSTNSSVLFEEGDFIIYSGKDKKGLALGFAILTAGTGFQDKIKLMYGVNLNLSKIHRLTIIEQKETPGLGAKIMSQEAFLQFWENKDSSNRLTLHKPPASSPEDLSPSEVNAITGATISSEKVLEIINLSLKRIKELKSQGKLINEVSDGK